MKQTLLLFCALSCYCSVNAQNIYSTGLQLSNNHAKQTSLSAQWYDKPKVSFGFKAGANFTNMNFNKGFPAPSQPVDPSWNTGLVAGLFMEVPVIGQFYVQPEYLYAETGGADNVAGNTFKMSYLSLPLLFKYKPIKRLALMAGPQFDLLIKAKQSSGTESFDSTHDTEERSIAAVAGIEFNILEYLSLNARYMQGFNHIGIGQRSSVKEFKYEMAQLSAALKF